ncbi:MAG TPA: hypothetical protein VLS87_06375, partial [Woeseiaceae bacterium]|nr:hypothetical protein [Woeseiaceae bacterium]
MTFRFVRARAASAVCLCALSAACSSTPQQEPVQAAVAAPTGGFFVGTRPVYAHLVNERGGSWVFTTVTASDASIDSGYLVRLNDLTPAFDTRAAECTPQVYPESHRCSPLHPFRDKATGMLDKIISGSIAVGTAGKVTDISQTYETRFDETAFNRAVDEALVNSGLDAGRRQLISLLDAYHEEAESARAELAGMTQQLSATRSSSNRVELDVQPAIDGLTAYFQDDIDFTELVELVPVAEGDVPAIRLEKRDALPCDARHCMAAAESALSALRRDIQTQRARLSAVLSPGARIYDVRCDDTVHGQYLLTVTCPAQIVVSGDEPVELPINVTILSRDFERLYPSFDLADERLRISIARRSVTFTNATNEYLTLTAQTVYYNSKVHTTSLPIDIPPGISITRKIDEFVSQSIDIESNYR